jgi:hypothetical protein
MKTSVDILEQFNRIDVGKFAEPPSFLSECPNTTTGGIDDACLGQIESCPSDLILKPWDPRWHGFGEGLVAEFESRGDGLAHLGGSAGSTEIT